MWRNRLSPLVSMVVLSVIVLTFGAALVALASVLGPKAKQSKTKQMAYECGLTVTDSEVSKIPIKFYLTAILFILFDIEIIFMYPWALVYKDFINEGKGLFIFMSMAVFLVVFIFGLLWEIKSNALEWE
jgi:NADH-quinone oxidoreductase subunit A